MKTRLFQITLVGFALAFTSCGDNADSEIVQPQVNDNNTIDTATRTIRLPETYAVVSATETNTVYGPTNFQGMQNLERRFQLPRGATATYVIKNLFQSYANCSSTDIRPNVVFRLELSGRVIPVYRNQIPIVGDGRPKVLIARLENVDCLTAGFEFNLVRLRF